MRAVVECATSNAPPPEELRISWQCERWNALPDSGGIHEQDYLLLYRMAVTSNIYNSVVRIKSLQGRAIHSLSDNERMILRMLYDNGLIFHA